MAIVGRFALLGMAHRRSEKTYRRCRGAGPRRQAQHNNTLMPLFLLLLIGFSVAGGSALFTMAGKLAEPRMRDVSSPPKGLPLSALRIARPDGGSVAAWFAPGNPHQGGVLLVHGIRADRRQMLARARFLLEAGYAVLLIDLQAHGETPGEHITFGFRESVDVHAAADYLRTRIGGRPIGVIGVSMGGAASLLGESPVDADAVVIEGVYSSIEQAASNRLAIRFGEVSRWLAPLLVWQVEPRIGVHPDDLAPSKAIRRLDAPVMIIAGTEDRRTRVDESKGLYLRANSPKRLWLIHGARHEDFHRHSTAEYERRVLGFFDKYLADPATHRAASFGLSG